MRDDLEVAMVGAKSPRVQRRSFLPHTPGLSRALRSGGKTRKSDPRLRKWRLTSRSPSISFVLPRHRRVSELHGPYEHASSRSVSAP